MFRAVFILQHNATVNVKQYQCRPDIVSSLPWEQQSEKQRGAEPKMLNYA